MNAELKKKRWTVTQDNEEYIQNFKILNDLNSESAALRFILKEHEDYKKKIFDLNYISESIKQELLKSVSDVISENILKELRRVRLGTNNTDRNTQILIELVQGWMVLSNVEAITATENFKPDFLSFVESVVQNRITNQKQKKDAAKV